MRKRIAISRTPGEFNYIDNVIIETTGQDFNKYLRSKIRKLAKQFCECETCITPAKGDRVTRAVCIDADLYEALLVISGKMQKPVNSIIDDFFIAPLLLPETV